MNFSKKKRKVGGQGKENERGNNAPFTILLSSIIKVNLLLSLKLEDVIPIYVFAFLHLVKI